MVSPSPDKKKLARFHTDPLNLQLPLEGVSLESPSLHLLLHDAGLWPGLVSLHNIFHELQFKPEGLNVVTALQQEDPSTAVQARRLADPHVALGVGYT